MIRYRLWWFVCMVLAPAGAALAAEHGAAEETHGGGGPDIFSGDWGTVILTVSVFVVLLVILRKWAWKPILMSLQKREDHIRNSIENAERTRDEAEATLLKYQEQLAQAQTQAQAIIDKGRAEADTLARELMDKAKEQGKVLRQQAEQDIVRARDEALEHIYQQAGDFATEMARKIIKRDLNAEDHRALLSESLSQLQSMASES